MVGYENRQPPEGINVSREHPLRTFATLAIAAIVLVVATVAALRLAGGVAARQVPFEVERRIVSRIPIEFGDGADHPEAVAYLNELAGRLAAVMPLPEGMGVTVHYDPADTVNAFATAGGNLVFYRGLLERMPHENALAMVVAHEIAHVLHRDPLAALGGGVASTVALLVLTGNAGSAAASEALNNAGLLTGMSFTRRMERAADEAAVEALGRLYGHVDGAAALFELAAGARGGGESGEGEPGEGSEARGGGGVRDLFERFASTHPLDVDRIEAIDELARTRGIATEGETTPLPPAFGSWLDDDG